MSIFDEMDALTSKTRDKILKPPFPWHGGKQRTCERITDLLPYGDCYCEAFGGSAAVLLARRVSKLEIYNDRFGGVTDFYRCLRDEKMMNKMMDWLDMTVHSREEFISCRDEWMDTNDPVERASKWYYMNIKSFGSHGRNFGRMTNPEANTTFAGKMRLNKLKLFPIIHERFKNVQVENLDFEQCLKDYDSESTVFYLDPPYMDAYFAYNHPFPVSDHIRLLKLVFKVKGYVALSGYPNEMYDRFPWDERHDWEVTSSARALAFDENNCKADETRHTRDEKVTEVLWIKRGDHF